LIRHIQKEDNILFCIAAEVLDEKAFASLGQAFEQAEEALGVGTHDQYEQMALALEKTWGASRA
jgi:hemerythrin-like domain-containing protein